MFFFLPPHILASPISAALLSKPHILQKASGMKGRMDVGRADTCVHCGLACNPQKEKTPGEDLSGRPRTPSPEHHLHHGHPSLALLCLSSGNWTCLRSCQDGTMQTQVPCSWWEGLSKIRPRGKESGIRIEPWLVFFLSLQSRASPATQALQVPTNVAGHSPGSHPRPSSS